MTPRELSHELRNEQSDDLNRRRWIIGLSLVGTAMGQLVTLYQTGIIKRLPDPPLPLIDSNKVDASDYAYKRFQTPDAVMMIVNYGLTAWLASAGGKDRAKTNPALPLMLASKTLVDSISCVELGREEWKENKAFCFYCQIATLCSFATLALSIPEALKAWKNR